MDTKQLKYMEELFDEITPEELNESMDEIMYNYSVGICLLDDDFPGTGNEHIVHLYTLRRLKKCCEEILKTTK